MDNQISTYAPESIASNILLDSFSTKPQNTLHTLIDTFNPELKNKFLDKENKFQDTENKFQDKENKFLDTESKFQDTENKFLDTENKFQDTENKFLDTENKFQDTENKFLDTENKFLDTENKFQDTENKFLDTENKFQDKENKFLGTESKFQDTENKFLDTENKFQDTENKFQDTENKFQDTEKKFLDTEKKFQDKEKKYLYAKKRSLNKEKKALYIKNKSLDTEKNSQYHNLLTNTMLSEELPKLSETNTIPILGDDSPGSNVKTAIDSPYNAQPPTSIQSDNISTTSNISQNTEPVPENTDELLKDEGFVNFLNTITLLAKLQDENAKAEQLNDVNNEAAQAEQVKPPNPLKLFLSQYDISPHGRWISPLYKFQFFLTYVNEVGRIFHGKGLITLFSVIFIVALYCANKYFNLFSIKVIINKII
ncbi:conserved rodent malaria protein, unknown function [Plasmodium berghei]|uniref:Skeleton-binding protein 1 n=1 Tax=Plasmodium berghei TaxID=5821 RepID=A0A1C6YJ42_PLABE|nr:conserved rodent malaria protein, unknown function [Plasmodium berghei]